MSVIGKRSGWVVRLYPGREQDAPGEEPEVYQGVGAPWSRKEAEKVARWLLRREAYRDDLIAHETVVAVDDETPAGVTRFELVDSEDHNGYTLAEAFVRRSKHGTARFGPRVHPALAGVHPWVDLSREGLA